MSGVVGWWGRTAGVPDYFSDRADSFGTSRTAMSSRLFSTLLNREEPKFTKAEKDEGYLF